MFCGLFLSLGAGIGLMAGKMNAKRQVQEEKVKTDKFRGYYDLLNKWLKLGHQKVSLDQWFEEERIQSVAIYGLGEIGYRLVEELQDSNVTVKYGIDKNSVSGYDNLEIRTLDEKIDEVDAIIVTPIFAFNEIAQKIEEKYAGRIVSMEDIIFDLT